LFFAPGLEAQRFETDTATLCASSYSYNNPGGTCQPPGPERQSFGYVGWSLDVGYQAILPFGLVIAASMGVQDRFVVGTFDDSNMPWWWNLTQGAGLRPRMRISMGWAFR
jgi:hypothetical protein